MKIEISFLIVLFGFFSVHAQSDLVHAPPNLIHSGASAVFVDIQDAHYNLIYGRGGHAISEILFFQPTEGYPVFNFLQNASVVKIDSVDTEFIPLKNSMGLVVVNRRISRGQHTLYVQTNNPPALEFKMRDEVLNGRGVYLDSYLPTNLQFDQFQVTADVDATRLEQPMTLVVNAVVQTISENHWRFETAPYFTNNALFYRLLRRSRYTELRGEHQSRSGKTIDIRVYPRVEDVGRFQDKILYIKNALNLLENNLGDWPYDFVYSLPDVEDRVSMEYSGAFTGDLIVHEMIHSYFARGIFPASGNDEWFDEFIATALSLVLVYYPSGWPNHTDLSTISRRFLTTFSPYQQGTPVCPHGSDQLIYLNTKLSHRGGVMPYLRHLVETKMHQTMTTQEFIEGMEQFYSTDLKADFRHMVGYRL